MIGLDLQEMGVLKKVYVTCVRILSYALLSTFSSYGKKYQYHIVKKKSRKVDKNDWNRHSPESSATGMGQFPICKLKWDLFRTSVTACTIDENISPAPFGIFYVKTEIWKESFQKSSFCYSWTLDGVLRRLCASAVPNFSRFKP